jgi:hypothetical protein
MLHDEMQRNRSCPGWFWRDVRWPLLAGALRGVLSWFSGTLVIVIITGRPDRNPNRNSAATIWARLHLVALSCT